MRTRHWLAAIVLCSLSATAGARPSVELSVVDRATGEPLPVYWHRGERWVAGTPGARYAVSLHNRGPGRVLAVLSVDGINAVTGETAAWDQNGYVLAPDQRAEILGWRKSQHRVAAFEFTALPDAYATLTGRPDHVGVIGVAVFREAPGPWRPVAPAAAEAVPPHGGHAGRDVAGAGHGDRKASSAVEATREPAPAGDARREPEQAALAGRLGTGHGRSESSPVALTSFERAQARPDQVLTIRYDSRANLVALGVIRPEPMGRPHPFPGTLGFVPDPPRR